MTTPLSDDLQRALADIDEVLAFRPEYGGTAGVAEVCARMRACIDRRSSPGSIYRKMADDVRTSTDRKYNHEDVRLRAVMTTLRHDLANGNIVSTPTSNETAWLASLGSTTTIQLDKLEDLLRFIESGCALGREARVLALVARDASSLPWRPVFGRIDLVRCNDPPANKIRPRGNVRVVEERPRVDVLLARLASAFKGEEFVVGDIALADHGMNNPWMVERLHENGLDYGTRWPTLVVAPTAGIKNRPYIDGAIEADGPVAVFMGLERVAWAVSRFRSSGSGLDVRPRRFQLLAWDYRGRIDQFRSSGNKLYISVIPHGDPDLRLVAVAQGRQGEVPLLKDAPGKEELVLDEPVLRARATLRHGEDVVVEHALEHAFAQLRGSPPLSAGLGETPPEESMPPAACSPESIHAAAARALDEELAYVSDVDDQAYSIQVQQEDVAFVLADLARASSSEPSARASENATVHGNDIDIGILTIREDEFRAVLAAFPDGKELRKQRRHYNVRTADAGSGQNYRVAILRQLEQGNGEAQDAARDMIDELRPTLILVVGIAGGLPHDDFTLGDVVVSTRINDYSVEARKEGEAPSYNLSGGAIATHIAAGVANLPALEEELGDWGGGLPPRPRVDVTEAEIKGPPEWAAEVRHKLAHHFGDRRSRRPIATAGIIASSDRLVKDPAVLFPWVQTARHLLAVEMESAGVYRAARDRAFMLAIRGVSDIIGLRRDDGWTKYACASAAAFARAFLRTTPVVPKKTTASPMVRPTTPDLQERTGSRGKSGLSERAAEIMHILARAYVKAGTRTSRSGRSRRPTRTIETTANCERSVSSTSEALAEVPGASPSTEFVGSCPTEMPRCWSELRLRRRVRQRRRRFFASCTNTPTRMVS